MDQPYVPQHHLHMSTGFAFVAALAVVSIVGLIAWAVVASRKPKVSEREVYRPSFEPMDTPTVRTAPSPWAYPSSSAPWPRSTNDYWAGRRHDPARSAAPVIVNTGSGDDGLLTGVLSGDRMAARGHTTTIVEAPVYEAPVYEAPSIDSGFTYDSGSSVSDAGMSGGFDLDW